MFGRFARVPSAAAVTCYIQLNLCPKQAQTNQFQEYLNRMIGSGPSPSTRTHTCSQNKIGMLVYAFNHR